MLRVGLHASKNGIVGVEYENWWRDTASPYPWMGYEDLGERALGSDRFWWLLRSLFKEIQEHPFQYHREIVNGTPADSRTQYIDWFERTARTPEEDLKLIFGFWFEAGGRELPDGSVKS